MEFKDTAEEAAFRTQVRSFIDRELPTQLKNHEPLEADDVPEVYKQWRKSLSTQGWIAPHWPKEYGGAGMSVVEQFVFNEEMAEARAPQVGGMGVQMIGPVLIRFGTDEQKAEHLPGITSGDVQWCQGYSEPGSGSDLASLQTTAVRDGDDYVINGSKIWTSGAHRANWMFMLARTDPAAPKHRGISMFLLPMKAPGIQVNPLITMAGDHVFNQEYFDDVRVPAKNLVGEENRGWYIGAALLDFERSNIASAIGLKHSVNDLAKLWQERKASGALVSAGDQDAVRNEIAERRVEAEIGKLISYRLISIQKRGGVPNYEASMNKLFGSEVRQRIAQTGMRMLGPWGALYGKNNGMSPRNGNISHTYLASVSGTIAAGTSEVNRNVIATRGLGLPRS